LEDLIRLESISGDKIISEIITHSTNKKPFVTLGVTIRLKDESEVQLGKNFLHSVDSVASLNCKVSAINVFRESGTDKHYIVYYTESNQEIARNTFYTNAFTIGKYCRQQIPANKRIVGVSCTTNLQGHISWINFIAWEKSMRFVDE
jgi:hypothetical protein